MNYPQHKMLEVFHIFVITIIELKNLKYIQVHHLNLFVNKHKVIIVNIMVHLIQRILMIINISHLNQLNIFDIFV